MNNYQIAFIALLPLIFSIGEGMWSGSWDAFWYILTQMYYIYAIAFVISYFILWLGKL